MNKVVIIGILCLGMFAHSCVEESKQVQLDQGIFAALDKGDTGIDFSNDLSPSTSLNIIEYLYYYNGGGVAVGDINKDGLDDIYFTANQKPDQLYLNLGNLKFENISKQSGIDTSASWSSGVSMDDINGDGYLDIYVCKVDPVTSLPTHNQLYINNGDQTFDEQSELYGLDFSGYATQASFFDYDLDGDLDVYLLNHSIHSIRSFGKTENRDRKDTLSGDRLFENRMNEKEQQFVDVTEQAGIYSSALGYGLAIVTTDLNEDGFTDIYVGNDFHENDYVYINNGDKTFTESMASLLSHSSKFTMGVDISDIDRDGRMDIFTTDMLPYDKEVTLKSGGEDTDNIFDIRSEYGFEDQYARNHMQIQQSSGYFTDVALQHELYATDWSWSILLQDFDNNGYKDAFITNGIVNRPNDLDYINFLNTPEGIVDSTLGQDQYEDFMSNMPSQPLRNILFSQDSLMAFTQVKDSEIGKPGFSNGAAYSDLDNDGDLDIVVNNINSPASILENRDPLSSHYIAFELRDSDPSRTAKGTRVKVYSGSTTFVEDHITTRGYQSSSTHKIHIGLANYSKVDSVVITWPGGQAETFTGLAMDQAHVIIKANTAKTTNIALVREASSYKEKTFNYRHIENPYKDYNQEKLIPELISKEGPATVVADFNGDGRDDIYLGGARFQEPTLLYGEDNGTFIKQDNLDLRKDAKYEDTDAVAFDYDQDGDLDLYIVSGGSDMKELDKNLEDRLYLNNGKGQLKRLPVSLPHTNGSTVSTGDIDGDGYPEIFVGARSIPGSYGLSPFSFILKNKQGLGIDIVDKRRYGMLTDSAWADMDSDGDLDIVICGDWMPITILINNGDGTLTPQLNTGDLAYSSGLWNDLLIDDFDQDGQMDILAANAGTNLKWKASASRPIKMDVLDIDHNSQTEPLIFVDYFGEYMPFASLMEISVQAPALKKKFLKNADYSRVNAIDDLQLEKAAPVVEHKELKELRSMLYTAQDTGYKGYPLSDRCQQSTIQDFQKLEGNRIAFVGNHHEYLTALGKNNGNSGAILSGFDSLSGKFLNLEELPIAKDLNTRTIHAIDRDRLLISVNNDPYLLLQEQ